MIHRRTIITLFTLIFVAFSTKADESVRCNRTCGTDKGNFKDVPYPFGFSSGCKIRLNCTDGDIRIGEFKVQNITGDNILINIPAECNRTIQKTKQLFSPYYALTWQNGLMLRDCASPLDGCRIPITMVKAQFGSHTCGLQSDNISCYPSADDRLDYATYEQLEQTGCRFFFTSIAVYESDNLDKNSTVSLQYQTAELGWWLNGPCRCSKHADCTSVGLPDSKLRFRCRCKDGFEGDGFADGRACRGRADDEQYTNCSRLFQCGNLSNIGYPLWEGDRPSYCVDSGFELSCKNNVSEITIESTTYRVLAIDDDRGRPHTQL